MKTTEQYFQEFYNEVRYQIEQGSKANFTRANQIWAEYEAAQQSVQADGANACHCGDDLFAVNPDGNCAWCKSPRN